MGVQFTSADFRDAESTERTMRRFERELGQRIDTTPAKLPSAADLAASLAPYMREQLQANGSAPLNLQSLLLPGQGQGVFLEDTHANRLITAPNAQTQGAAFFETDRLIIYIANTSLAWQYAAGIYVAAFASRPSDLGTNDIGFLFYATDQFQTYLWTGAAWATVSNRILIGGFYGIFTHANTADRTYTLPNETGNVAYATSTLTSNRIILGAGTAKVSLLGSLGTTTTVLHGNAGGAPTFGAVDLAADVSGILPAANGGTGIVYDRICDTVSATGQNADIGATAFTTSSTAGTYRASYYMVCTTADAGGPNIQLQLIYSDDAGAQAPLMGSLALTNTLMSSGVFPIQTTGGGIQFAVVADNPYGPAEYSVYLTLERLS